MNNEPTFLSTDGRQAFIACELSTRGNDRTPRGLILECAEMLVAEIKRHSFEPKTQYDGIGFEVRLINVKAKRRKQ